MHKAQSELKEFNHKHDEIKMERRILRGATESITNQSNDINSNVENNALQVESKTNEKLEMLKKANRPEHGVTKNNTKLLNIVFTTSTECNHVLKN